MSSGELLNVDPLDLKYPFELKKQISCSLHLSNKTLNHVAFRVKTTNPKKYCVRPNKGIVLPGSTYDLIVTMQAQKEAPSDMQCKDKFLLQSVVANPRTTPQDFTQEMFKKEAGRVVDECRLTVIYILPPQPPFPVAESSKQPMKDNGHLHGSEVVPIWLNCMPIKGDLDEAKYVHDQLCSLVERLDRQLIGPNYQGLPKIISVFAEVLCSEKALATKTTANRMINVLRHLQQILPPAMWESAWSYLLPRQVMIKNLEELLVMILNCFQDSHPRVRWAACMAICQLLTDFSPHLQEEYHNQVLLALAAAMDDFHPQVQAFAAGVLSDFFQSGKPEMFIPYLDGIVNKLLVLLQTGKQMVQKEALNALSHIALCVEEHFRTYYDTVIPHLKAVLRDADLKSNLHFRARAMYCISHVGFAVGKEKFREDTEQVMEVLIISFQGLQMKEDEPSTEFLLKACTRICNCLGQDFLPYMSAVIPFIMQFAQPFTELDYENNGLDDKIMKRLLEDKATACITLSNCAAELKEDFYSWIPEVVSVLLPLLKFYSHNNIRKYAVGAMYPLLHSAKLAVEKGIAQRESESYFKELSDYIILSLLEALHEEPMTKICAFMLGELNNCLQISPPLLIEGQLRRIVDEVKHVITESSSRKRKLKERAKSEDFDAEEDELLGEEKELETEIFVQVGTVVCTLIEIFKAGFLPFFDELSPYLITMWGEDKTVQERCTSVYLIDHLVMKCPEAALKYSDVFLPLLLDTSNDEIPKVRQNALYGLALYAVYGGSVFKPFISEAISRINVVITHLRARERENESVYYTAVFALSKICQFHLESIDSSAQVVLIWLNSLPVKGDLDKADYVHGLLCLMVQWLHGEHIDPNYHYLPKIISVFAEVICSEEDLATEETANCMINTLRYLQLTLPPATLESAWSYLLPQQEMKLKYILSPEEDAKLLTNSMKSLLL